MRELYCIPIFHSTTLKLHFSIRPPPLLKLVKKKHEIWQRKMNSKQFKTLYSNFSTHYNKILFVSFFHCDENMFFNYNVTHVSSVLTKKKQPLDKVKEVKSENILKKVILLVLSTYSKDDCLSDCVRFFKRKL